METKLERNQFSKTETGFVSGFGSFLQRIKKTVTVALDQ